MKELFNKFKEGYLNNFEVIKILVTICYDLAVSYLRRINRFIENDFFIEANEYLEKWGAMFSIERKEATAEQFVFEKTFPVNIDDTVTANNNKVYRVIGQDNATITVTPIDDNETEGLTRINDRQSQSFSSNIISATPYVPIESLDRWRDRIRSVAFRQVEDAGGILSDIVDVWDGVSDPTGKWIVRPLPQNYLYYYDDDPSLTEDYYQRILPIAEFEWRREDLYRDDLYTWAELPLIANSIYVLMHKFRTVVSSDELEEYAKQIRAADPRIIPIFLTGFDEDFLTENSVYNQENLFRISELNRIESGYKLYSTDDLRDKYFLQNGAFPLNNTISSLEHSFLNRLGGPHTGLEVGSFLRLSLINHGNYVTYSFLRTVSFQWYQSVDVIVRPDIVYA